MQSNIYESEPFTVQDGCDISLSPISIDSPKKKKKEYTHGLLLKDGKPAEDYIIKVFKIGKNERKTFIGFTFTDSFGRFLIPLPSGNADYMIKAYSLKEEVENLELIIE